MQRYHRLPKASVITPYAGGGTLIALVQGLDGQTIIKEHWELILVTEREPPADVMWLLEQSDIRARVVFCERQYEPNRHSGGYLRNRGAHVARSDLLIFIDSDCVPSPNCVSIHIAAHRDSARREFAACGGMRELSALVQTSQSLDLGYRSIEKFAGEDFRGNQTRSACWQDFYSANVSIGRKVFDAVSGFDESGLRCHDMDLGYRLHKEGCVFRLLPRSGVIHIEHPRSIQSRFHQSQGWVLLGKKCPEIGLECERQARLLVSSFDSISVLCEKRFAALTSGLPGFRASSSWVISPEGLSRLWGRMSAIPHCVQTSENGVQINLRLHRSCWDYSINLRKPESVHGGKKPRITVVVTTYNHESFLDHAITSVLTQTEQDFELLIIDDASEDDTCYALATYAHDPRIRIYTNPENIGLSQCLNKALELAKADFILQLDADDYLLPSAIAKVLEEFRDPDVGAVCAGNRGRKVSKNLADSLSILGSLAQTAPRAYRVAAAKHVGGWSTDDANSGRYFEDRLMLARIAEGHRIARVDKGLYRIREVGNSLSRRGDYLAIYAKLSIVTDFANQRALDVRFAPSGTTVKPFLRRRIRAPVRWKWSIIIPCFSNVCQLQYTLAAWQETDLVHERAEIIVVDDGSKRPIERDVSEAAVRIVRLPTRTGAANARNCGASVARGEMLMFCDADHVVPPDIGKLHERTHLSLPRAGAAVGVVREDVSSLSVTRSICRRGFDVPSWSSIASTRMRREVRSRA
jgi:glycosyltransferase involved in cell wall biosynthesis